MSEIREKKEKDLISSKEPWIYRLAIAVVPLFMRMVFPCVTDVTRELGRREGPFILYCNHISMWDPLVAAVCLRPRRAFFMAKSELEVNGFISWLLRSVGAIWVKRGESDMQAIRLSLKVLKEGHVFGIFPEGTRNKKRDGSLLPFFGGVSLIALKANVPCIPMYIEPRTAYRPFRRTHVYVGDPITFDDLREGKRVTGEILDRATARMEDGLRALMPDAEK